MLTKDNFIQVLENEINALKKSKLFPVIKDLNDCIVFSCVFCFDSNVLEEKIKFKIEKNALKESKDKDAISGMQYEIMSNDKLTTLKVVISPTCYYFEKFNDTKSYVYKSLTTFDKKGNFSRDCLLVHEILNNKQVLEEKCYGNIKDGPYLSCISEDVSKIKVEIFKLPDEKNGVRLFYKYTDANDYSVMYRSIEKFKDVPFLESIGMSKLSDILSEQFEGENKPLNIDDEMFFKKLVDTCKNYYFIK